MIRVAGLHDQVDAGVQRPGRRRPHAVAGHRRAARAHRRALDERQTRCSSASCAPALAEHGIRIVRHRTRSPPRSATALDERFRRQIFPVLTPLAVGLGRPFPYISNLSLSLAVLVRDPQTQITTFARVKVPKEMLPRFVPSTGDGMTFVPLEELIAANLDALFPGMEIVDHGFFRVTRDADFEVSDEADDLLRAVEAELRRRRFGEVVRLEVDSGMSPTLRDELDRGARGRGAPGLRRRRPARPHRPVADRQAARLQRAARPAVDAGDPAAPAGRGRRPRRHLRRHPRRRRPRPPPLRLVRDVGRALRRAGGRRPRRPRDQDDRVPHVRRHAARARADPRDRARQAGGVPGRAQGALRRAREHPAGRARWRRRASTSSTGTRRSRRTPSACSSCAARATACATTSTSGPATTTRRRRASTPTSASSPADEQHRRRRRPTCSTSSPASRGRGRYRKVLVAPELPARRDDRRDRAHGRRARGAASPRASR